jgi:ribulose-5-phosphate 4-epimerase/fuculose-1-phosphate aldolase
MGLIRLAQGVSKFCIGMEGNISARITRYEDEIFDGFCIKASGTKIGDIQIDNLVAYDLNGNQKSNLTKQGSIEKDFHRAIYSRFKEIQFIAHTHPINTLKVLCSSDPNIYIFAKMRMYPEQVIFNGASSIIVPYACPGPKLANEIQSKIQHYQKCPKLILLRNHGIIACGETPDECIYITETCEKAAEVFTYTGTVSFFSNGEVDEILDDEQEKYRMRQLK